MEVGKGRIGKHIHYIIEGPKGKRNESDEMKHVKNRIVDVDPKPLKTSDTAKAGRCEDGLLRPAPSTSACWPTDTEHPLRPDYKLARWTKIRQTGIAVNKITTGSVSHQGYRSQLVFNRLTSLSSNIERLDILDKGNMIKACR